MATASMPVDLRVEREAISQTRSWPDWSVHSTALSCVHFASEADRGRMLRILGAWVFVDMVKRRGGRVESKTAVGEARRAGNGLGIRSM